MITVLPHPPDLVPCDFFLFQSKSQVPTSPWLYNQSMRLRYHIQYTLHISNNPHIFARVSDVVPIAGSFLWIFTLKSKRSLTPLNFHSGSIFIEFMYIGTVNILEEIVYNPRELSLNNWYTIILKEDISSNRSQIEFKHNYKTKLIWNFFNNSLSLNTPVYRLFFFSFETAPYIIKVDWCKTSEVGILGPCGIVCSHLDINAYICTDNPCNSISHGPFFNKTLLGL